MNHNITLARLLFGLLILCFPSTTLSQTYLVQDGQPRAEIVIAPDPPRTTKLAAQELQLYLKKISGATLPIVVAPNSKVPVKVFVGQSKHTEKRDVTADALKYGAYRIATGNNWMALVGNDTDFTPIEPWPRNNRDWVSGRIHAEWHRITDSHWGNPLSQLRKHYTGARRNFWSTKPPAGGGRWHGACMGI